jgi:septal ring factor EnvC (AmiA/AmiB activator)
MARKTKSETTLSVKEEALNQVINAQKEKIEALTEYGKKLKIQLKEFKDDHAVICSDIEAAYKKELAKRQSILILGYAAALLFGMFIGMIA